MKLLFWLCFGLTAYTYFGYVALLWVQARLRKQPIQQRKVLPAVSILIAARNEEANLPGKLKSLQNLNYPQELLQIVIVSDGSTDRTASILNEQDSYIISVILGQSHGKAYCLNEAVKHATGEILIFQDARQLVDAHAIIELVSCFADTTIGAVSGELLLEAGSGAVAAHALGLYWKIEKTVRKLESASGSVIGATGAIYAIRSELYINIPEGTILDDVIIPMNIARAGKRVVFQPTAIVRDRIFSDKKKEFSRKIRTLTGNYQLLRLAPWLFSPVNPLLFRFISHKLLRLIIPLLLFLMLVTSGFSSGSFYRDAFYLQVLFYAVAVMGIAVPSTKKFKFVAVASTFIMLNAAAAVAFCNFICSQSEVWNQ